MAANLISLVVLETPCDFRPLTVAQTGARILRLLTLAGVGQQNSNHDIAQTLQKGWAPQQPEATALLRAALILGADHELNVSTFTARCVASTNSTPYAVVTVGLAALQRKARWVHRSS